MTYDGHIVVVAAGAVIVADRDPGLGYAAALELARRGEKLTLVMRDRQKAQHTVAEIQRETGNSAIRFELADLSLMSVAYARQKRALMVLTQAWAGKWADDGIVVNAMHPGWADTPGVRDALPQFRRLTKGVLRSADDGADTIVWLAVATEAGDVSGELFLDREMRPVHLVNSTREAAGECERLLELLKGFGASGMPLPRAEL